MGAVICFEIAVNLCQTIQHHMAEIHFSKSKTGGCGAVRKRIIIIIIIIALLQDNIDKYYEKYLKM